MRKPAGRKPPGLFKSRKPHPNAEKVPEGQRRCPICGEAMEQQTAPGVTVDVCEQHGVWFDKDEFESLVAEIKSEQVARSRRVIRAAEESIARKFLRWGPYVFDRHV